MNANNPYRRAARLYETNLRLPVISRIRRDEARVLGELIARYADMGGRALEVGPGTGFYTRLLAGSFREVVAIEEAPGMVAILRGNLAAAGVQNVRIVQGDFRRWETESREPKVESGELSVPSDAAFTPPPTPRLPNLESRISALDHQFDVAVAIGVLDYIAEPGEFVAKMCAAARRAVIITAPQRGLLGRCFVAGGAMRKTRVYCYHREAIPAWAPGWRCTVTEAGRATRLTKGLTLVAAFEYR
jgi:SAM-dependent methyltransferase